MQRQVRLGVVDIRDEERRLISDALERGRLSPGPYVREFEQRFAAAHGSRFAITCNSGTSALQVSLAALKEVRGWRDGDEVIVPALTFIATSNVVIQTGLVPRFCDVDRRTANLDPERLAAAVGPRTRAVIPVHLFGQPCDMDPIQSVARAHDLAILEDSCQTMFASYRGRSVGAFGELGCFSTYVAHILVTGVGGVITTSDPRLDKICRSLIAHGRDEAYLSIDDDDGLEDDALEAIIRRRFSFVRLGYSYRWTELEAALGLAQLGRTDEIIGNRRHNAARLCAGLAPLSEYLQLPWWPAHSDHSFMVFPVIVRGPVDRDDLVFHLEKNGIETRFLLPLLSQPVYRRMFGDLDAQCPVASSLASAGFYLPCHHQIDDEDVAYVIDVFWDYFESRYGCSRKELEAR